LSRMFTTKGGKNQEYWNDASEHNTLVIDGLA